MYLLFPLLRLLLPLFFLLSPLNASDTEEEAERDDLRVIVSHHHPRHRRWRRAPAVWGEPAPDYSAASLDTDTHIFLYALLFVDLKTSDHYRREHSVVRREVMRLANEANSYFFQINVRLLVVDILETFRDDLSLYSFEQFRNQRLSQLPFHNFAALISYRHAGGLAFVGGMCSGRNVMLAGFYPHNPEAMGSIFFHEVAHLVGVPHRPANESFAMPNCACPRRAHAATARTSAGEQAARNPATPQDPRVSSASVMVGEPNVTEEGGGSAGCLKIPGFDHDCSLQWMVNLLHQRNRCLSRDPRPNSTSLALCGNGVVEAEEECDCGPAERKCAEWNCEAGKCRRRWPLWSVCLLALCFASILLVPPLGFLIFARKGKSGGKAEGFSGKRKKTRRREGPEEEGKRKKKRRRTKLGMKQLVLIPRHHHHHLPQLHHHPRRLFRMRSPPPRPSKLLDALASAAQPQLGRQSHNLLGDNPLREIWRKLRTEMGRIRWRGRGRERERGGGDRQSQEQQRIRMDPGGTMVRRPQQPPPPPPPNLLAFSLRSQCCYSSASSSSLSSRPKVPPPPTPTSAKNIAIVRPQIMPPTPPPLRRERKEEEEEEEKEEEEMDEEEEEDEEEEDEWDDDHWE